MVRWKLCCDVLLSITIIKQPVYLLASQKIHINPVTDVLSQLYLKCYWGSTNQTWAWDRFTGLKEALQSQRPQRRLCANKAGQSKSTTPLCSRYKMPLSWISKWAITNLAWTQKGAHTPSWAEGKKKKRKKTLLWVLKDLVPGCRSLDEKNKLLASSCQETGRLCIWFVSLCVL